MFNGQIYDFLKGQPFVCITATFYILACLLFL